MTVATVISFPQRNYFVTGTGCRVSTIEHALCPCMVDISHFASNCRYRMNVGQSQSRASAAAGGIVPHSQNWVTLTTTAGCGRNVCTTMIKAFYR